MNTYDTVITVLNLFFNIITSLSKTSHLRWEEETGNMFPPSFLSAVFEKGFISTTEVVQAKQGIIVEEKAMFCIVTPA